MEERSALINNILSKRRRKFGSEDVVVTSEMDKFQYKGIYLPPLCLRYLLNADIWPLEHIILGYGNEDTCKSSFALQIGSWFIKSGGQLVYIDTEGKFPVDIAESLLGIDVNESEQFDYYRVKSADSAQNIIFEFIEGAKDVLQQIRAHNESDEEQWEEPSMLIVLDSLAGALSQEERDSLDKDGHSTHTVAVYARKWTNAFTKIAEALTGSNVSLFIINHEHQGIGMYASRSTPGGRRKEYLAFLKLRFLLESQKKQKEYVDHTERWIKLNTEKNSMGTSDRTIEIPFIWDREDNFYFDFDQASIEMLKEAISGKRTLGPLEDLTKYSGNYSSKSLDFKQLPADKALETIQENEAVLKEINNKLGIHSRHKVNSDSGQTKNKPGEHEAGEDT